jgi:hypothetical protein
VAWVQVGTQAQRRGAAESLQEGSGRRESRWEGEGKKSAGTQESRKGRKREQQAEQLQTHRKKKSSTEAAVGTSEQEPD